MAAALDSPSETDPSRRDSRPAMRPSVWQVVFILTLLSHASYAIFAWPSHLANALGWNRRSLHLPPLPDLYEASVTELQVCQIASATF